MFEEIKNRLGFGTDDAYDQEFGDDYDAYADNYDDFSSYDEYEDDGYSSYAPVTTRDASVSRARTSADYTPSYGGRSSSPRLVTYEDVRASTRIPESLNRDPLPPRRSSVGRASDYTTVPNEDLYTQDLDTSRTVDYSRSSGYDSLFTPSPSEEPSSPASEVGLSTHAPIASRPMVSDSYDPYKAYEGGTASSASTHRPTRKVTVITPAGYDEVENVARLVRAGDVVVLSLRATPSTLSKRILDFSFGVASALNASVDCIADKVFAITLGESLTENERAKLRNQGIL